MRTHVYRWLRIVAVALVAAGTLVPSVQADNLNVKIQRIDVGQFPNVRAYVSIASSSGVPVTGLDSQSLVVQEDGAPVTGLVLNPTADAQEPIVTALVFNVGASMANGNKLDQAKTGAMAYVDSLGPNDRTSVVSFASRVTVVQDYTTDKAALKSAIDSLSARGNSLLFDAIDQTSRRQAAQPEGRKPVILLTDSDDATSAASLGVAIATASMAGTPVYTIGLGSDVDKDVLTQISSGTGGQAVFASDPTDLKSTFLSIDDFLRRLYVLRYTSKLSPDGSSHGLAVQATSASQQGMGLSSFKSPTLARVSTGGLTPGASVSGVQQVTVDAAPLAAPTVAPAAPVASSPAPTPAAAIDNNILVGVALLLLLMIALVWYLSQNRSAPAYATPAASPPAPQATLARGDRTVVVDGEAAAGMTMVRAGRERIPPQVRLAIVRNGRQLDFGPTRDSPLTLGRARDRASVVIDDPLVSSEHLRIRRDGTQFVLEDLKSKNGTQVNGVPIAPETPRPLNSNDRIYLGDTVVTFVVDAR